jgi:hypothetical protein
MDENFGWGNFFADFSEGQQFHSMCDVACWVPPGGCKKSHPPITEIFANEEELRKGPTTKGSLSDLVYKFSKMKAQAICVKFYIFRKRKNISLRGVIIPKNGDICVISYLRLVNNYVNTHRVRH